MIKLRLKIISIVLMTSGLIYGLILLIPLMNPNSVFEIDTTFQASRWFLLIPITLMLTGYFLSQADVAESD